jgi:hypothetical protein
MLNYSLCFKLGAFNELPVRHAAQVINHLVQAMIENNMGYLETHKAPLLYQSGVRYSPDNQGSTEMQWWDIPSILNHGFADCKGLAAWRVAELRHAGYSATPEVITQNGQMFHVRIRGPNGIEDPSKILGM